MNSIVGLLRLTIGLDAASIGLGSIERAVARRMCESGVSTVSLYVERLRNEPDELSLLIEEVVVPETWFFRDPGAFAAAAQWVSRVDAPARVRFLSVPCATGEEPYSLVMALLDAGFASARFEVEAADVSDRVLRRAAMATYGRNSFRGGDLGFRERFFQKSGAGYVLLPTVKDLVRFRRANITRDFGARAAGSYDVIFCRNLLIYFDRETQVRVLDVLRHLLAPDGLLFVAPSESSLAVRQGFAPAGFWQSSAFYKTARVEEKGRCEGSSLKKLPSWKSEMGPLEPLQAAKPRPSSDGSARPFAAKMPVPKTAATPDRVSAPTTLADAVRLADEGRFAEVDKICRSLIQTEGGSAETYCLLAMVSDASGRPCEAVTFYRKALYLDPRHRNALMHFSLLASKMGDAGTASALRERALRLETISTAK